MKSSARKHARPSACVPTASHRLGIRQRLLDWYDRNKRDLPWRRRQRDAYAQWVAEIMLQQTRVETVERYYERFLERFPDVGTLARARESSIMKSWEGLGYYRRARNLHRAAKRIAANGGRIPGSAEALRKLPGIGAYTAAAIASIAFDEVAAAVDGNVARVIARLFAITEDVRTGPGGQLVSEIAGALVSCVRPGDLNQACMDLGSTVCTPQAPSCRRCPLARRCRAYAEGIADQLPVRSLGRPPTPVRLLTVVFVRGGRILMVRDPAGGWWSGLWSFPSIERKNGKTLRASLGELAARHGLSLGSIPQRVSTVCHQLTHRTLTFDVRIGGCDEAPPKARARRSVVERKWVLPGRLDRLAISIAHRKIWALAAFHLP